MSSIPSDPGDLIAPPYSYVPAVQFHEPLGTDPAPKYEESARWGVGPRHLGPFRAAQPMWHGAAKGDELAFYANDMDSPIASRVIDDVNTPVVYLTVPNMPSGNVKIRSRVRRAGTLEDSYSEIVEIEVLDYYPAGYDQEPAIRYHSGIIIRVEGKPRGSILSKEDASLGLRVWINKWLYARKNDRMIVYCAGIPTTAYLSEEDAKGDGPYPVDIPPDVLNKTPLKGEFGITATLRNVVDTPPGGEYKFSRPYKLISERDPALRDFPYFLIDDYVSDELNLSAHSGSTLAMEVTTQRTSPIPKPLNQITPLVTLQPKDGPAKTVRLAPVTDTGRGTTLKILLQYDLFKGLEDGHFRLSYESHTPAGVVLARSGSCLVNVTGQPVSLPAPTVVELLAGLITSDKDATVIIPPNYVPYDPRQLEISVIEAVDGSLIETDSRPAGVPGGTRTVTQATLKKFEGKRVNFYYIVVTSDGTRLTSQKTEAQVGTWVGTLPAATVQQAEDGYIDPETVVGDELLAQFPYAGASAGQVVTYSFTGKNAAGSFRDTFTITDDTAHPIFQSMFFPLPITLVTNNLNSESSLRYSVEDPKTRQVFYSEVARFYIGKKPTLELAEVVQAGPGQYEILPKTVNNGADVVAHIEGGLKTDRVYFDWQGSFNLSAIKVEGEWNAKTKKFHAKIPRDVIALGVRKEGNKIALTYHFHRGQRLFTSEPSLFELRPLEYRPQPKIIDAGADETILRLHKLSDAAVTHTAPWNLIDKDQIVTTEYTGTLTDGTLYTKTINDERVTADQIPKGFSSPSPVADLRRLKDRSNLKIRRWIDLTRSGNPDAALLFEDNNYIIEAVASKQLPPEFSDIPGVEITINAPEYENKAFLAVKVAGMRAAQTITPELIGPDGKLEAVPSQKGDPSGRIDFPVSNRILANMVNKGMTMRFTIATSGGQLITSDAQQVNVLPIPDKDMPQVLLNKLPDNSVVDFNKPANVVLDVSKWPLSFEGQHVLLELRATGIAPLIIRDWVPTTSAEATNGLKDIKVLESWLARVPSNTKIIASGKVIYDGSGQQERAIAFRSATYTVIAKLTVNTPVVHLNGLSVRVNWARTGLESFNNTSQLVTTGGSGKVTWVSNAPHFASVTASGFVKGNGWGAATLTGTDAVGNKVTCAVHSSNVYNLNLNYAEKLLPQHLPYLNSLHRTIGFDGIADMQRQYGHTLPGLGIWYWGGYYDAGRGYFWHYQYHAIYLGGENNHAIRTMGLFRTT